MTCLRCRPRLPPPRRPGNCLEDQRPIESLSPSLPRFFEFSESHRTLVEVTPANIVLVVLTVSLGLSLGAEQRAELLAACSRALPEGRCVFERDAENDVASERASGLRPAGSPMTQSEPQVLRAVIRQNRKAQIVVRLRAGTHVLSSELSFEKQDAPLERARAIGLTAGVLAGSLLRRLGAAETSGEGAASDEPTEEGAASDEPNATGLSSAKSKIAHKPRRAQALPDPSSHGARAAAAARAASQPAPAFVTAREPRRIFLGLHGAIGFDPGTELGEAGGLLQGGLTIKKPWRLRASVHGFSALPQDRLFRTSRLGATMGLSLPFSWQKLEFLPFAEAGAELLIAHSRSPAPPATGSRWSPLMRLGCLVALSLKRHLQLQFGPQVDGVLSPTSIIVGNVSSTTVSPVRPFFTLGLATRVPTHPK